MTNSGELDESLADVPLSDLGKEILGHSKSVRAMRNAEGISHSTLLAIFLVYALTVVLSAPLILFPDVSEGGRSPWNISFIYAAFDAIPRYSTNIADLLRFWSCVGILCIPLLGFWRASALVNRLVKASSCASAIDDNTSEYRHDPSRLREKYRHQLGQEYETFVARTGAGNIQAVAVMEDALRLAAMDRWERASAIVDTQAPALLSGIGLLAALQRISLQLGILFTFIGLTMALTTEAFRGVRDVANINLDPLIGALQVAFCSSIAGLIASIALIIMGGQARVQGRRLIAQLEAMADNILNLAKLIDADPKVVSDLSEIRRANQRLSGDVAGMRAQFADAMQLTRDTMLALQKELQLAREAQDAFRGLVSSVQNDGIVRSVKEGVIGGVQALADKINTNVETTERLVAVTKHLTSLEIQRVDNFNHVKERLKHLEKLLLAAPPAAETLSGSMIQTLNKIRSKLSLQRKSASDGHDNKN